METDLDKLERAIMDLHRKSWNEAVKTRQDFDEHYRYWPPPRRRVDETWFEWYQRVTKPFRGRGSAD